MIVSIIKESIINIDPDKIKVIVKDLPLYKGVGPYGYHGVAPVSKLMSK
jgi:hypothetical protein